MASLTSRVDAIPDRSQLFTASGNGDLQPFLNIKPPAGSDTTPPSLSFERKREVEIPWSLVLGTASTRGETSIAAIRDYFERSWGLEERESLDDERFQQLISGEETRIKPIDTGETQADQPLLVPVYKPNLTDPEKPTEEQVKQGIIIQHGSSGRWYLLIPQGQPLSQTDLATPASYAKTWEEKIDGVELVFTSPGEATAYFSEFSEIDLRPAVIHRAFNDLLQEQSFASSVSTNVDKVTGSAIEQIIASGMNTEELEGLQERVFRLKLQEYGVNRRIEQLQSQASDLGFYLFLKDQKFSFPDGKSLDVKSGEIYRQYRRTARWTTSHSRRVRSTTKLLGFIPIPKTVTKNYSVPHSSIVTDYAKVDTAHDPVANKITTLRQQGMNVFLFERGPSGFITRDGTLLRAVMEQCDRNEDFRRRCVVMLPIFEESLTGLQALTKYSVFTRPAPGISPTTLPRLTIQESLSYRTAWRESHLGELVNTINLAPGEERTVVMTKTFEQETTVSRSTTSIFDVSRSESNDLATEMENQARSESERSSNMQLSATAKGSYGFVSAEATASGGTSTSLKDFSQAISKVARKASQALNQQNHEEVSSSSSAKTTVSNKDETTATIRNINQGRTLNLLFYRLLNKFEGGIYVDDLQFEVIPSVEIIAGSGVYEALRFGLGDLPAMIDEFQLSRLPFITELGQDAYQEHIVESLESLLRDEYGDEQDNPEQEPDAGLMKARKAAPPSSQPSPPRSVGVLLIPKLALQKKSLTTKAPGQMKGTRLERLSRELREVTLDSNKPTRQDDLLLGSSGLYMDTVVGALPATEPYTEEMRAQEVRMRAAEVLAKQADADYQQALARRLGTSNLAISGNWFTGIYPDSDNRTLGLRLKAPLPGGRWDLLIDGEKKARLDEDLHEKKDLAYTWEDAQMWLDSDDLIHRVSLRNEVTGDTISFGV